MFSKFLSIVDLFKDLKNFDVFSGEGAIHRAFGWDLILKKIYFISTPILYRHHVDIVRTTRQTGFLNATKFRLRCER